MKTLYLTDLDGTFLNNKAEVSDKSKNIINFLISKGMLFTLSTARTFATVTDIFKDINLNVPLVLMNGVCIYDIKNKNAVSVHPIDYNAAKSTFDIYMKHQRYPLLYFLQDNGVINIYYKDFDNKHQQQYIYNRKMLNEKKFIQSDSPSIDENGKLIYIVTLDEYDKIKDIHKEIVEKDNMYCAFYSDNYTGCYFLEAICKGISKGTGALEVKKITGADRIVAFGDNKNDIPIFEVADECYAVENACDELKNIATGIIGNNNDDAVAEFLMNRYENNCL